MQLPASDDQRRQLMSEFQKSRRPQKVNVQLKSALDSSTAGGAGMTIIDGAGSTGSALKSASLVYLIPPRLCTDAVGLDFAALCVSPPVDGGGLRSIDSRLEPLLVPTNNVEHSAHILSTFEKKVSIGIHKILLYARPNVVMYFCNVTFLFLRCARLYCVLNCVVFCAPLHHDRRQSRCDTTVTSCSRRWTRPQPLPCARLRVTCSTERVP